MEMTEWRQKVQWLFIGGDCGRLGVVAKQGRLKGRAFGDVSLLKTSRIARSKASVR